MKNFDNKTAYSEGEIGRCMLNINMTAALLILFMHGPFSPDRLLKFYTQLQRIWRPDRKRGAASLPLIRHWYISNFAYVNMDSRTTLALFSRGKCLEIYIPLLNDSYMQFHKLLIVNTSFKIRNPAGEKWRRSPVRTLWFIFYAFCIFVYKQIKVHYRVVTSVCLFSSATGPF